MKDIVSKVKSFVTFELPVQPAYVHAKFASLHEKFQSEDPTWSLTATKQKLIAFYWFRLVPQNFVSILAAAFVLITLCTEFPHSPRIPMVLLLATFTSFAVLFFFYYKPVYQSYYLPTLQNAKSINENKHLEKTEKCRKLQLSNFTLMLIVYVFAKNNRLQLPSNDNTSNLLTELFGIDPGSIKKCLQAINAPNRVKSMTQRKISELQNRFDEAYSFLTGINYHDGLVELEKLQNSFFQRCQGLPRVNTERPISTARNCGS